MEKIELTKRDVGQKFKRRDGVTVVADDWDDTNLPMRMVALKPNGKRDLSANIIWYKTSGVPENSYVEDGNPYDIISRVTRGRPKKVKAETRGEAMGEAGRKLLDGLASIAPRETPCIDEKVEPRDMNHEWNKPVAEKPEVRVAKRLIDMGNYKAAIMVLTAYEGVE